MQCSARLGRRFGQVGKLGLSFGQPGLQRGIGLHGAVTLGTHLGLGGGEGSDLVAQAIPLGFQCSASFGCGHGQAGKLRLSFGQPGLQRGIGLVGTVTLGTQLGLSGGEGSDLAAQAIPLGLQCSARLGRRFGQVGKLRLSFGQPGL